MITDSTPFQNSNFSSDAPTVLLRGIRPRNLLSFGPETPYLPLGPLNILIGANGSGKSNLIEAICLLRASAESGQSEKGMQGVLRKGGGVQEWIWKGNPDDSASLSTLVSYPPGKQSLHHRLEFVVENQAFLLTDEFIENEQAYADETHTYFYYRYQFGRPIVNVRGKKRALNQDSFEANQSILVQRRDPEQYPEITYLAEQYGKICAYREWAFGRNTVFRKSQGADEPNDRLAENFSNLGLILNRFQLNPRAKNAILTHLQDIYEGVNGYEIQTQGGTVQVFFTEGDFTIPATRLSDGTLRYLCLLAILCDPTPPPLICIEEPELGLHPDILPKIGDLLRDASTRTQLIVTTHSDILVDAMTETPEAILVCEKHNGQTQIERLNPDDLSVWLEKYRLGELWTRGELGGTRW